MPVVELHLLEGYDDKAKQRLGEALTDAIRLVVPAEPDLVTVMIHERSAAQYMRGRRQRKGAAPLPDPAEVVRAYLDAMEARDIDAAKDHLGEGFVMTFPGAAPMTRLEELVDWSRPRYARVAKSYEAFETCATPGPAVVYARGTLHGAWTDGTPFEGIRFIDRFEVADGRITKQDVWNDIAEVRP